MLPMRALFILIVAISSTLPLLAQTPEWIWFRKTDDAETRFFRKTFTLDAPATTAELVATADDNLEVFINGRRALRANEWGRPQRADIKARLKAGRNVIAIRARNGDSSPAGVLAQITITTTAGKQTVVTDASWKAEDRELADWNQVRIDDAGWLAATSLGKLGIEPWGNVLAQTAAAPARPPTVRQATPVDAIYKLKDFNVELIQSGGAEDGSWVNLCQDDKGRLIVSPQYRGQNSEGGLLRFTLGQDGRVVKREFIARPLYDAQGMVFANGALWVVVNRYSTQFESGLYRITDDGSDTWNKIDLVKKLPGGGEHGPHAVELGPDGNLWVMAGNHTKPPEGLAPDSPHKNYQEDHVLPRQPDGNGHATGVMAPGGYICRVSPDGSKWEFFCGGFRNQFDFAFNVDDELFVFDADMEYDWGMPWYRPTRVNHAVSGAEFGWRYGTGKWPEYHADSLGAAVDIGLGSPTGVGSGKGAKFPGKYQRAIYVMDWTFGRLIAVHLQPDGASYTGTWDNFVAPAGLIDTAKAKAPLNVTDLIIGNDGAMYFTIGGRETAAGLYRVTYTGTESTAPAWTPNTTGAEARKLRRELESFHGKANPRALDFLWPHLNNPERSIRYAARIALEAQPISTWQARAREEASADGGLAALLALARVGGKSAQDECWKALAKWPLASLAERQQLDKLRILQISIARHGLPSSDVAQVATEKLSASYPSKSDLVNRELSQVLIALGAPDVVAKTLPLMSAAKTQEDLMHYLFHLRTAKHWTPEQRREYLGYWSADRKDYAHDAKLVKWFEDAGRPYANGASFNNFLKNFLKDATANLTGAEKTEFAPLLASFNSPAPIRKRASEFPAPKQRTFVKSWTMADFAGDLEKAAATANFQRGRQAFVDAQCLACHRLGDEGGGVGPDLTAISSRFKRVDMLESILDPNKVLSEQFLNTTVFLKNGDDHTGRLVDETPEELVLVPNQLEPNKHVVVKKADIANRRASAVSPMPAGLADVLSREEILDLLAFMESGGQSNHALFNK
ncbi:MAG: c-type cytochrome [Opitutaceae bacterium]|nr:c-type cytochrome [Verrucomicrobiales bacterium]